MPVSCRIYGLGVEFDVPVAAIAGLGPAPRIDLRCHLGTPPAWIGAVAEGRWVPYGCGPSAAPAEEALVRAWRLDDGSHLRLRYADGTEFVLESRGREVWATWPHPATIEDTATYLLGPVMGFVLRLRGTPCLHASAVAIDGRAVAIAGPAGGGKSSTAAAFARLGVPVLTDDVAALSEDGTGVVRVEPAYPGVRLWPDSVAPMFGSADALPLIAPPWPKRFLGLGGAAAPFQREPLPLAAIYVLGERRADLEAPAFTALGAGAALIELVGQSYVTYLLDKDMRAREFDFLARLVASVPVVRVSPVADIGRISRLCRAIAADVVARRAPRAAAAAA